MDLIIRGERLGLSASIGSYRGTYRAEPSYCEDLGEDHPVNQICRWHMEEGGQIGVVHDLKKAQQLVTLYRNLRPPQKYDLLEVIRGEVPPAGTLLGYDLSSMLHYSLLSWGLRLVECSSITDVATRKVVGPIAELIERFFRPRLNPNGLFDDYATAKFCLDTMMALQAVHPNLWEDDKANFEIVGLCSTNLPP